VARLGLDYYSSCLEFIPKVGSRSERWSTEFHLHRSTCLSFVGSFFSPQSKKTPAPADQTHINYFNYYSESYFYIISETKINFITLIKFPALIASSIKDSLTLQVKLAEFTDYFAKKT